MIRKFVFNDGGRSAANIPGTAGDCVTRATAILSGLPYLQIWHEMAKIRYQHKKKYTADDGMITQSSQYRQYMESIGMLWVDLSSKDKKGLPIRPVFADIHNSLPENCILALSRHYATLVNGELHDTYDSLKKGRREVSGIWVKKPAEPVAMEIKDNRGGPGRNQGRKKKYGEATVKVNYKVPKSRKEEIDKYVKSLLKKWEQAAANK